jgi:plastocyanin
VRGKLRVSVGCLSALLSVLLWAAQAGPALAANATVTATPGNAFTPQNAVIDQGDMVTWNNGGGLHNVHFDDNSFVMPASPSGAAWSVSRTFSAPGMFRYYCELHGGPNGAGMSGAVWVNGTGYARPKGATPMRASLAPAFKQCTAPNRTHGAPLAFSSCSPPAQASDFLTVGTPDANMAAANSIGSALLRVTATPDVQFVTSITDVRNKTGLADYTGELQARLPLSITDRTNGPGLNEPATGSTTYTFAIPCTATISTTTGSTCSITTTANALTPGAVIANARAIWEMPNVQVFDGGSDGVASTAGNTLFAKSAVFVP